MDRNKQIIRVSIYGIIVNIVLVGFKSFIGLLANSIAIILDAINNLSDALSSIITIIGTKLSLKMPNKKHPFGYGRVEYFSSIIIAILVFIAGLTSLRESILKIIKPEIANYSILSLIVIAVAVLVKFFFGRYVKMEGEKLRSKSLIASGMDAISDSILSFSTLIAAIVSFIWKVSLEGYLGAIISIIILKSAFEILKETIDEMIGSRSDIELTKNIKKTICNSKEILGVYDLTLHSYGPNKIIGTAHIEIQDSLTARNIHRLTRRVEMEVYEKYGIILTLGIYATNEVGEFKEIKSYLKKIIKQYKSIIQMHGFYVDEELKIISFDLIFDFEEKNVSKIVQDIKDTLKDKYSEYNYSVIIDADISD